jgi:hypothetical protein
VIVHDANHENAILAEIPYGPVKPETEIKTPYGVVMTTMVGGNIDIFVKHAVDDAEYRVAGRIIPEDQGGHIVGPILPYGPVKPYTTIQTAYGKVEVTTGGDIIIKIKTSGNISSETTVKPKTVVAIRVTPQSVVAGREASQVVDHHNSQLTGTALPQTARDGEGDETMIMSAMMSVIAGSVLLIAKRREKKESSKDD